MDANGLMLCSSEIHELHVVSQEDMPVDKLAPANVESPLELAERCCHFSIRGYVADTRKSGRKVCSPFCESLDMSGKPLPPITVAKFRWWECPSCFLPTRQRDKREDDIRSLSSEDGKQDISSEGSQLGATCTRSPTQLSSQQEISAEIIPRIAETGSKHSTDSGKSDPLLGGHIDDPGMSTFSEDGGSDLNEVFTTTRVPCHQKVTGESHKVMQTATNVKGFVIKLKRKNSFTRLCGSDTPDTVNSVLNADHATTVSRRSDINCYSSNSMDKLQSSSDVNICVAKEDAMGSDMMVHISELVSRKINSSTCEASEKETWTDTSNIDYFKSYLASENLNHKRIQKTRLLSDILNSESAKEGSVLPQNEVMTTKEDSILPQSEVMATKEDSVIPHNEIIEPENNYSLDILQGQGVSVKEHRGKATESKKRFRISEVEEDGSSLLSMLKRKIKKAKGVKIHADNKNINSPDINQEQRAAEIISRPFHCKDGSPSIERHVTDGGSHKKHHAEDKIDTVQKEIMQMKQCKDAIQESSVHQGSVRGTKHVDGQLFPVIDLCSNRTEHVDIEICNKSDKKVMGMNIDAKMKDISSVDINTEQKIEFSSSNPLHQRNNLSSVEKNTATNRKHKKKIKGNNVKNMHRSSMQMNHSKDAIPGTAQEGSFKGTKHIANPPLPITYSGIVHPEAMINNEPLEKAAMKPHKMKASLEEKKRQVNSKGSISFQRDENTVNTRSFLEAPKKLSQSSDQKCGMDSVDGIPVEILKLLQENWQKRHADVPSFEGKSVDRMNDKKIDRMPDLTSDAGNQLSTELCRNWKSQHSQCMNHLSQTETVVLEKDFLSASPKYQTGQPSHYNANASNILSNNAMGNACYYKSTDGPSSGPGACNEQAKISRPVHAHEFGQQIEPSLFVGELGNGLGISLDAIKSCLPENQCLAKLMSNTCGKAQSFGERGSGSGYNVGLPSVAFNLGQYQKIPSAFTDMSVLLDDHTPTANRIRKEDDRLENIDTTAVQLQRWKHAAGFRTNQEIHSISNLSTLGPENGYNPNLMAQVFIDRNEATTTNGYNETVMPPVDNHRNEVMSAMNLLRLMDSGACSSESLGASKDRNISEFGERLRISHSYQHGQSLWFGSNDRNGIGIRHQQPSDYLCQHPSRYSSNLYKPDARIGVPLTLSVKDRITNTNCFRSHPLHVDGHFGGFDYSSEKYQERNFLTSQTRTPVRFPFSTVEDPQVPQTPNLSAQSPLSHKLGHASHSGGRTEFLQPPENRTGICVLNRNPADFTIPDDNNEYMIGYSDRSTKLSCMRDVSEMLQTGSDRRKQSKIIFPKRIVRDYFA